MSLKHLRSNLKIHKNISNILTSAYYVFLLLADHLAYIFPRGKDELPKKKILFIKLDAIGDFMLWLDAAKDIRRLFPQNMFTVALLGNEAWSSLAAELPYFDVVWSVNRHKFTVNPFYRLKVLKKIRQAGFHTVIQPTYSRESLCGDAVVRVSGAEEKIGSQGDCSITRKWVKHFTDRWYTRLIPASEKPLMELLRNAEFMRGLGLEKFQADIHRLPGHFAMPVGFNIEKYYVLFPGAGKGARQWPLSHFRELANRIYQSTGWAGVICGGEEEKTLGYILEHDSDSFLKNWCGKTSIEELTAVIAGARILIGNETSAVHIAAAVCTPAVCILGGGHYGRFMPYKLEKETDRSLPVCIIHKMNCFGCNWHCIYGLQQPGDAAPCVSAISVDQVWEAVRQVMIKKGSI